MPAGSLVGVLVFVGMAGCSRTPPAREVLPGGDYLVVTSDIVKNHGRVIGLGADGPLEARSFRGVGMEISRVSADRWQLAGTRSLDLLTITKDGRITSSVIGNRGVGLNDMAADPATGKTWGIVKGDSGGIGRPMPLIDLARPDEQHRLPAGHFVQILDDASRWVLAGYDVADPNWPAKVVLVDKATRTMRTVDPQTRGGIDHCVISSPDEATCIESGLPADSERSVSAAVFSLKDGKRLARASLGTWSGTVFVHRDGTWIETKAGLTEFDSRLRRRRSVALPADQVIDSVTVVGDTAHVVARYDQRRDAGPDRVDFGTIHALDLESGRIGKHTPLVLPDDDLITTIRVLPTSWFGNSPEPTPTR